MTKQTSSTNSLAYTVQTTLRTLHNWASNQKSSACGANRDKQPHPELVVVFENGTRGSTHLLDDSALFGESKTEDSPYFNALRCTANDITAAARRSFNCPVASDDLSCTSEDDQMRRLGSWGTFGTLATNESLETSAEASMKFDDDGNVIDPVLLEKAKLNREKFRLRKRAVKFAYPPITSLKQCPRVDPTDLGRLFFSTEELDTYENDRRSTGTVDDVEIVAVSTSVSDDVHTESAASSTNPTTSSTTTESSVSDGSSQKSGLARYLSPKTHSSAAAAARKGLDESHPRRDPKQRRGAPRAETTSNSATVEKPKEKRLLKSVQIFLRARSTGN